MTRTVGPPGAPVERVETDAQRLERLEQALKAAEVAVWEWRHDSGGQLRIDPIRLPDCTFDWPGGPLEWWLARLHAEDTEAVREAWRMLLDGRRPDIDVSFRLGCIGQERWLHLCGRVVRRGPNGGVEQALGTVRDMTPQRQDCARRNAEACLTRQALQDPLTGLANRAASQDRLQALLRRRQPFGLLFIDLDGFKEINDSYGHSAGDSVLCEVARRCEQAHPPGSLLGRWGGDEFVLLLPPGSGETEVRAMAQSIIAALNQPMEVGSHEVTVTPSIGAVLAPRDGDMVEDLLRKVDAAMYAAKERGRNGLVFFDESMAVDALRRVRMLSLMRVDAERNAFSFAAQPKVDRQGRTVGAELLMRWPTEAFGQVSPGEFIPLAEKVGLISLMGRHAIHAAARLAARAGRRGLPVPIAVNLSPKQLQQPMLDRQLLLACQRQGIQPAQIELELTESALLAGLHQVAPLLQRLRQLGFGLALDDFGTGYSSLSYLRHLPFNKVKIDRSFVMDIDRDPRAAVLLRHIVELCGSLGMTTVAEGVETTAQFEALCQLGVQEFQGFLFARPMPPDEWLARLNGAAGGTPGRYRGALTQPARLGR